MFILKAPEAGWAKVADGFAMVGAIDYGQASNVMAQRLLRLPRTQYRSWMF